MEEPSRIDFKTETSWLGTCRTDNHQDFLEAMLVLNMRLYVESLMK
jgi:hypothetical protein